MRRMLRGNKADILDSPVTSAETLSLLRGLRTPLRAAVAAAVMTLGPGAPRCLARLSVGCAEAARALAQLSRAARAAVLAQLIGTLWASVPEGLGLVHRDWIEAELVGETTAVREAVAGGGRYHGWVRHWLQRRTLGQFVAMPATNRPAEPVARLAIAEPPDLLAALAAFGRQAFAAALVKSPWVDVAAVAAQFGEPHGHALVQEISSLITAGEANAVYVQQRAEYVRSRSHGVPERMLIDTGIARLGHALVAASGDGPRQLAQRLPRRVGSVLWSVVLDARRCSCRDGQNGGALTEVLDFTSVSTSNKTGGPAAELAVFVALVRSTQAIGARTG